MKITEVRLGKISVPLRVPFKTALRSVDSVEDVVVEIHTDTGHTGYGEAPPTGALPEIRQGLLSELSRITLQKVLSVWMWMILRMYCRKYRNVW